MPPTSHNRQRANRFKRICLALVAGLMFWGCQPGQSETSNKSFDGTSSASVRIVNDQYVFAGQTQPIAELVARIKSSVVGVGMLESGVNGIRYTHLGSGAIIDAMGNVLVLCEIISDYVLNGTSKFKITLFETAHRHQLDGRLLAMDPETNLAMLRILPPEPVQFTYVQMDNGPALQSGDWLLAIGSSDGMSLRVAPGLASALDRGAVINGHRYKNLVLSDLKLKRGGYGCPIFSVEGALLGFYLKNKLVLPLDNASPVTAFLW